MSALHKAAGGGHRDVVLLLLQRHKVNVDVNNEGMSAVFWAVENKHVAMVELALAQKPNQNIILSHHCPV
jgi:ankyrin repeat protein